MPYALSWLGDVLRAGGCKVVETEGWLTRGHGDFGEAKGVLLHDTVGRPPPANIPSLETLIHGRADLAGPLCNLGLARDGTYYCIAAGKGWHAGFGSWQTVPMGNFGNSQLIGIEMENDGVKEPWLPPILQAAHTGVAALLKHIGATSIMCAGHREYARTDDPKRGYPLGRKKDPDFSLNEFRLSLAARLGS